MKTASPRKFIEDSSKLKLSGTSQLVKSIQASPFRKEMFASQYVSTPLNHNNVDSKTNLNGSIEKRIRESRKKEVIDRLNELNNKFLIHESQKQGNSSFFNKYKSPTSISNSNFKHNIFENSTKYFIFMISENIQISREINVHSSYDSKYFTSLAPQTKYTFDHDNVRNNKNVMFFMILKAKKRRREKKNTRRNKSNKTSNRRRREKLY